MTGKRIKSYGELRMKVFNMEWTVWFNMGWYDPGTKGKKILCGELSECFLKDNSSGQMSIFKNLWTGSNCYIDQKNNKIWEDF